MMIIVGRTGSGKDHFASLLMQRGMKIVKPCTTRPQGTPDEKSHIFVTPEESAKTADKVIKTEINGYEYFVTSRQVNEADVCITDPDGLYQLTGNMPEKDFNLIYVYAADDEERRKRVDAKTDASENAQFEAFEDIVLYPGAVSNGELPANIRQIFIVPYSYEQEDAERFVDRHVPKEGIR